LTDHIAIVCGNYCTLDLTIAIVCGNYFYAVYSIPCGDCEKEYLGQSKRQFGTRLKEHQKAVSTLDKGKSALAEHVCYTKHEIAWENSKVITTNNHYGQI
jgi:hypothetical protein